MPHLPTGFERAGDILRWVEPDLTISKQKLRKAGNISVVPRAPGIGKSKARIRISDLCSLRVADWTASEWISDP
jgi:hypothetical protein